LGGIDLTEVLIQIVVLIASLSVHEAAHAWAADRLGDPTARHLGRLSLNPAVHVDPIGTLLFPLIAILTNLPLIGWAKPVPVDILKLRDNWREKFMAIAAAGPASNLLIAAAAALVLRIVQPGDLDPNTVIEVSTPLATMLELTVQLNVLLAVFNLIPVPPLDGGNVLSGLLRGQAANLFDRIRPYGFLILYAMMFTDTLFALISPPANFITSWLL
jgi:Zn-dependent protease